MVIKMTNDTESEPSIRWKNEKEVGPIVKKCLIDQSFLRLALWYYSVLGKQEVWFETFEVFRVLLPRLGGFDWTPQLFNASISEPVNKTYILLLELRVQRHYRLTRVLNSLT